MCSSPIWRCLLVAALCCIAVSSSAQLLITEIHYHPVEEPAFKPDGSPVMDLYEDVHEFLEIHNPTGNAVALKGWDIRGGIRFDFPSNAIVQPGEFLVVAKDPIRLKAVAAYNLGAATVYGPYEGWLRNNSDVVRLRDDRGVLSDSVSYSAEFPWAISADALGAGPDFTGIDPATLQYRGRSLERVSFGHNPNDPANWLASPLPGNPSPGRPNAVSRSVPKPVVVRFSALQASNESPVIRSNEPVQILVQWSADTGVSQVRVESFVENINASNEVRSTNSMSTVGSALFTATLPSQPNRSIIRYRFLADRGTGSEVVSPRSDDPYGWHAYYVSPERTSQNPAYDVFVSSASLTKLDQNISQSPRRVTSPDPPGIPRASWNATEPALFVHDGVVYEMRIRYHGSRYNRSAGRKSFKFQFPRYRLFNDYQGVFETDKGTAFIVGHGIFAAAGLPTSKVRYIDLYLNNDPVLRRLEQEEMDDRLLRRFDREQRLADPERTPQEPGEIYKSTGTIQALNPDGEGPYGVGDERRLAAKSIWKPVDRYAWTYTIQSAEWKGGYHVERMINGLWSARGDSHTSPNPQLASLRTWLAQNFDIDSTLTYLAIINWMGPWDDTTQNHFIWQQRNGKWGMLPWDFDAMFGGGDNSPSTASIYMGENGDPNNNFRGPNWLKDSFFKAYREEYKRKLFLLNNTLLHPDNLRALGFYSSIAGHADTRFASVNQQCGLGVFRRPLRPIAVSPGNGASALPPMELRSSVYAHEASPAPAHASTLWLIRDSEGSFEAPVFRSLSTNNLTQMPIPFAELEFGKSYSWRCQHIDANGHPSVPSLESSFTFGPASSIRPIVTISDASSWRYQQTLADPPGWKNLDFNDSSWSTGAPLLGVEPSPLSEPIRTPLTLGRNTYYFRHGFNYSGNPQGVRLRLSFMIDDGAVIYLNGDPLLSVRMPAGVPIYSTAANTNVDNAVRQGPFEVSAPSLRSGANVLAVEVHQQSPGSSDIVFGLAVDALAPAISGDLVINEIAADNRGSVTNGGRFPDWIELFNNTAAAVDLGGASLTDDILRPTRFVFPPGVVVPAQGYLVVWCDSETNSPGLHTGFGLNNNGQLMALFTPGPNGLEVRDTVRFGLQLRDRTVGRNPGGSATWALCNPTPGAPNVAANLSPTSGLRINEWMAAPATGDDWVELHNPGSLPVSLGGLWMTDSLLNPTNSRIPALSFIDSEGFVRLEADGNPERGADHLGFRLSVGGEQLGLFEMDGRTRIDGFSFGPQTAGVSEGRLPDGSASRTFFPTTHSPGESNWLPLQNSVVINEVLAHTDPPLEDAVELHNPSTDAVDISGWFLSDDSARPKKYRIPSGAPISPGGFRVFYENQFNPDPLSPLSFSFSSFDGDEVILSTGDPAASALRGFRTRVRFGASENGVSFGRTLTSVGSDFAPSTERTFGQDLPSSLAQFRTGLGKSNSAPRVGPVVIGEIMFRPPDLGTNDNTRDEFIELLNITSSPVSLFDPAHPTNVWRLRDGVSYRFPSGEILGPRGTLVVVSFDPITNALALAEFRNAYGLGGDVRILGPYEGKLNNRSDRIELQKPDAPQTVGQEIGQAPYVEVDHVEYSDVAPWPSDADGTGRSLQKRSDHLYGNDPASWQSGVPSPGVANGNNLLPVVNLLAPVPDALFPHAASVTLAAEASDPDGFIRRVEFLVDGVKVGEDVSAPYEVSWQASSPGRRNISARAIDDRGGVSESGARIITIDLPPNQLPTVSLVAPSSGAIFVDPANILLRASAFDSDGLIAAVEFYDGDLLIGSRTAEPYEVTYDGVREGVRSLRAKAIDNRGGMTESASIIVTVRPTPPNEPPSISWLAPADSLVVSTGQVITLRADAFDPDGSIARVEFYEGSRLLSSDLSVPYEGASSFGTPGLRLLSVVAVDDRGLSVTSALRRVHIVNSVSNWASLIATGAVWRFHDLGFNLSNVWRGLTYDDALWKSGPAQLGYGENDEATRVEFGGDPNNRFITTYFRKRFEVAAPESFSSLTIRLLRDDGAVVHVNDGELFRSNMPGGDIDYLTRASSNVGGADESTFFPTNRPA
ncbi:MAG: hypothetical protein FJ405_02085, partial [Verrucomicrobia bacterium]|nr:hypothetical protein [Verrucomicrobiota bacterium]